MAQHDYDIANQAGSLFRSDLNNVLSAIVSNNSGASAPTTTYAYMWWADTTNGWLKQRNSTNTAWISVMRLANAAPIRSPVQAKAGNYTILETEIGNVFRATAALEFAFTAVATLGDGWWCVIHNDSSGNVTLNPDGAEQINAQSTLTVKPGDGMLIYCSGSALRAYGISGLPLAGGTLTGSINFNNNQAQNAQLMSYREQVVFSTSPSSNFVLNVASGNVFDLTLNAATCTLTTTNFPSSGTNLSFAVIVRQDGSGNRTITWPNSTAWPGGAAPSQTGTANAVDIYSFTSVNGGAVLYGIQAGAAFA